MALSILVSETEDVWASQIKLFLEKNSYVVDIAHDGKDCQLKIYNNKYLAIVLDLDTKNHSGLEVLRYIRLNAPSVKVILSLKTKKRLEDLELDKDNLRKLGASDILIRPYPIEMLLESIEGASQFESWKKIKASGHQKGAENIESDDSEFTRIKIQDFYSGNTTVFDYYIRLSKNKYVKILHQGDFFEESRIKKYADEKDIEHLYFKTNERASYINFINQVLEKMLVSKEKNAEKKIRTTKNLAEKYIEEIYTVGLKPQLLEEGKKICQNMYNLIQSDPDLSDFMAMYEERDPTANAHLFLVSFFATIIAKNLEWSSQRTIELVAFASLLHDIGMLKLPQDIRESEVDQLNPEQFEKYKEHPKMGSEMLQQYPLVSESVRQIVYQHHEYVNGEGFPNGLTGIKTYPLAKIVALANEFANCLTKKRIPPLQVLKEFISDRQKIMKFDPLAVKALVQGFIREK
jgi:HD-GYP domain-containing protein (c-di-GMP phosphodiesterase class II)